MRTPRTLFAAGAAVLLGLGLLTSCAQESQISEAAADRLQAGVLDVATLASTNDFAGATTALDALQQSLTETTASGDVTAERSARIQELITTVRSDLAAAVPSTPTEDPTPEETTAPEPSQTPTPEPAESDEPTGTPSETPTAPDEENENEPDENEPDENEPDENENDPVPADPASTTGNNGNGSGNNNGVGPDGTKPGKKDK